MFKKTIFLVTLLTVCCSAAHSVYGMERFKGFLGDVYDIMTPHMINVREIKKFTDFESYKQYIYHISPGFVCGEVTINYKKLDGGHDCLAENIERYDRVTHIADLEKKLPSGAHITEIWTRVHYKQSAPKNTLFGK